MRIRKSLNVPFIFLSFALLVSAARNVDELERVQSMQHYNVNYAYMPASTDHRNVDYMRVISSSHRPFSSPAPQRIQRQSHTHNIENNHYNQHMRQIPAPAPPAPTSSAQPIDSPNSRPGQSQPPLGATQPSTSSAPSSVLGSSASALAPGPYSSGSTLAPALPSSSSSAAQTQRSISALPPAAFLPPAPGPNTRKLANTIPPWMTHGIPGYFATHPIVLGALSGVVGIVNGVLAAWCCARGLRRRKAKKSIKELRKEKSLGRRMDIANVGTVGPTVGGGVYGMPGSFDSFLADESMRPEDDDDEKASDFEEEELADQVGHGYGYGSNKKQLHGANHFATTKPLRDTHGRLIPTGGGRSAVLPKAAGVVAGVQGSRITRGGEGGLWIERALSRTCSRERLNGPRGGGGAMWPGPITTPGPHVSEHPDEYEEEREYGEYHEHTDPRRPSLAAAGRTGTTMTQISFRSAPSRAGSQSTEASVHHTSIRREILAKINGEANRGRGAYMEIAVEDEMEERCLSRAVTSSTYVTDATESMDTNARSKRRPGRKHQRQDSDLCVGDVRLPEPAHRGDPAVRDDKTWVQGSGFRLVEDDSEETDIGVIAVGHGGRVGGSVILSAAAIRASVSENLNFVNSNVSASPTKRLKDLKEDGNDSYTAMPVRKTPTKRWDGPRSGNNTPTSMGTPTKILESPHRTCLRRPTPSPTKLKSRDMLPMSPPLITSPPLESQLCFSSPRPTFQPQSQDSHSQYRSDVTSTTGGMSLSIAAHDLDANPFPMPMPFANSPVGLGRAEARSQQGRGSRSGSGLGLAYLDSEAAYEASAYEHINQPKP